MKGNHTNSHCFPVDVDNIDGKKGNSFLLFEYSLQKIGPDETQSFVNLDHPHFVEYISVSVFIEIPYNYTKLYICFLLLRLVLTGVGVSIVSEIGNLFLYLFYVLQNSILLVTTRRSNFFSNFPVCCVTKSLIL